MMLLPRTKNHHWRNKADLNMAGIGLKDIGIDRYFYRPQNLKRDIPPRLCV